MSGPEAKRADIGYTRVEDQQAVWEEARRIGGIIAQRLSNAQLVQNDAGGKPSSEPSGMGLQRDSR